MRLTMHEGVCEQSEAGVVMSGRLPFFILPMSSSLNMPLRSAHILLAFQAHTAAILHQYDHPRRSIFKKMQAWWGFCWAGCGKH